MGAPDYRNIRFECDEAIATITLNRPDKLNAYTTEMGDEVVDAFSRIRADDALRVVILTGAGRGFCAGVDLEHLKAHQSGAKPSQSAKLGEEDFLKKLPLDLVEFPKPVIAAINGAAIGVGVTMVLPCDLRIAADHAKIGLTFAKLGILPGLGSTHLLPRLVGPAKARELVLTAKIVLAPEAERIGLINKSVPGDELMKEAREWARALAEIDPEVLAAAKRALDFGSANSMADAMRNEQEQSEELRKLRASKSQQSE
ncbi:MAG: enoyl-CoA hydratase/isomerase family protein [bacterium]|nr:enoyl-CoA hydratase/isomerase family protein [bacterium]